MKQRPANPPPNILREIQANKVSPVYLLCGEESFLIEGTLKQMLDHLLTPDTRDFNLTFLEDTNITIREILSQADLYPVMSDWRVVVVRDAPFFKVQQRTTPITIIRNAFKVEITDPQKSISTLANLLDVSPQQIAENNFNYANAVDSLIDEVGTKLTDEERGFLERLPGIAQQLDTYTTEVDDTDDIAILLEWLQGDLPKNSVLIFTVQGSVNERNRVVKAIETVGRYRSFEPVEAGPSLNRDPLYKKVSDKFTEYGKQITPRAFSLLRTRTGGDMHTVAEAINKIVNFVGDKTQIDEQDVRNMVTQNAYDSIFDLTDAIGKRAMGQALKSLHEVLASGQEPIPVNSTIARQFRFALQAKLIAERKELRNVHSRMPFRDFTANIFQPLAEEAGSALPKTATHNILKQNPYVAYKIFQTLNAFTVDELVTALEKSLDADAQLKTSNSDATCILEQLVCELCTTPSQRRPTLL
ncbi:MAG: DNA polymerase III subunit delta [Candidatus Poribacteria bacterium]|nr:DNA polymerase III subunit delta [Candidatus Poribacteria bacterium]